MYDVPAIKDIKEDFLKTIAVSKEMTPEDVVKGRFRGWLEAILRLIAPLL